MHNPYQPTRPPSQATNHEHAAQAKAAPDTWIHHWATPNQLYQDNQVEHHAHKIRNAGLKAFPERGHWETGIHTDDTTTRLYIRYRTEPRKRYDDKAKYTLDTKPPRP